MHSFDKLRFLHGKLRRLTFAPFLIVADFLGKLFAENHVLDRDLTACLLVAALNDDARGTALVGIFHLRLHAGGAEIHLRADGGIGLAERAGEIIVVGKALAVHDEDDGGAGGCGCVELAEGLQRGIQARNADG